MLLKILSLFSVQRQLRINVAVWHLTYYPTIPKRSVRVIWRALWLLHDKKHLFCVCYAGITSDLLCFAKFAHFLWELSSFQWNGMIGSILLEHTGKMCHKCQGARTVVQLAGGRQCVSYKKSQDCRAAWKFLSQMLPGLPNSYTFHETHANLLCQS